MNIFRYYNQNRKVIWLIIGAIIILIIALQAINAIIREKQKNRVNTSNIVDEEEYKNNLNINVLVSDESVKEEQELVIDQFIRYCNAKKIEEAYSLLSNICKERLFPTIEYFKQNYYNIHFSSTKLYSKEQFIANTYKVKLYEDMLYTGSINTNSTEDYYTIEKQKDGVKLNISNYIGDKEINRTKTDENLKLKVVKKQIYKDYEEYEIEVTNLTYKTILLDSKENTKTMYLIGENNVKYYSLAHEVIKENLVIRPKATMKIYVKYNKEYNSNRTVNKLGFSDIILDYDLYKSKEKKSEYKDRITMIIDL